MGVYYKKTMKFDHKGKVKMRVSLEPSSEGSSVLARAFLDLELSGILEDLPTWPLGEATAKVKGMVSLPSH